MEPKIDTTPGAIISCADTWPDKWYIEYYRVSEDGKHLLPLVRAHFWCSNPGRVVDISESEAIPLEVVTGPKPSLGHKVRNEHGFPAPTA